MKKIIAILFAATILWSVTSIAMAETNDQPVKEKNVARTVKKRVANEKMMPAPEVQLERLTKGLQLTAEQQKSIKPMLKDEFEKLKEIRLDDSLSPKQIQAKVEVLRNETVTKMQTILTPDQKEKLDIVSNEVRANKQKRIRENRKSRIGTQADPPPLQPN
jgi:Spy/CpxP family protein refolding chaperone